MVNVANLSHQVGYGLLSGLESGAFNTQGRIYYSHSIQIEYSELCLRECWCGLEITNEGNID